MIGIIGGNVAALSIVSVTLSPAAVAANTTAEQTFAVPGVLAGDMLVEVNKPTAQAGLGIAGVRIAGANSIGVTFSNNTAGSITPTAGQTYLLLVARPESVQTGVNV